MDPRALIPALAVAAALAVAPAAPAQTVCGVPLTPPCPTPTPTPSATPTPTSTPSPSGPKPVEVSLSPSRTRLFYESPETPQVRFRGRLRSTASVREVRVQLVGRTRSGERALAARTITDQRGRYVFTARPEVNADYRVRVLPRQGLEGRSTSRRVLLQPAVRIRNSASLRGLRITGTVLTPQPKRIKVRPGPAARGHFYLRLRGNDYYQRVGTAEVGDIRCDKVECARRSSYLVRERRLLSRAERVLVCFGGKPYRDTGTRGRCPRRFSAD